MPSPIGPTHGSVSKIHGPHGINAPHAPFRGQSATAPAKPGAVGDQVTISPAAQAAAQATEAGEVRQDVVNRIRAEIAAGTYETPAKLDAALDRMLNELA